jgi:hypothetical protein
MFWCKYIREKTPDTVCPLLTCVKMSSCSHAKSGLRLIAATWSRHGRSCLLAPGCLPNHRAGLTRTIW